MGNKPLNRIKVMLAERMMTNKDLAEKLGKDPATISKWVTNTTQPSLENLIEISRCLKCEINSLVDFLLKEAKIAIEVKMSRCNLKDKEIGNQLIIDITKYKQHPDVKFLYCFVYDPDRNIYNPTGLENDLKRLSSNDLKVYVMVRPS